MRARRPWAVAAALLLGPLCLVACGGSGGTSSPKGAAAARTISIKDFAFHPGSLRVPAGTTVTVHNDDTTTHTVTADDKSFDTGNVSAGATATIRVPKAGTVTYHCEIHNYMRGSIQAS